jgi:hypothetical protein
MSEPLPSPVAQPSKILRVIWSCTQSCACILYVSVYIMQLCSCVPSLRCLNLSQLTAAIHVSLFLNRLFGIKSVIQTDCASTWKIIVNPDLSWYHHANPILLLVMYYTLATLIRIWLQEPLVRIWKCFLNLSSKYLESLGDMVSAKW